MMTIIVTFLALSLSKVTGESAAPPTATAQCSKPEVLQKCIAWGRYSKEDNGCKAYANGWKKRSNGCHSCSSTRRDFLACDLDQCTAFCGEMYRGHSGDKSRCITGCEKYAELLEASNVYVKGTARSNSCPKGYGHIKTHGECKLAGDAMNASLHRTPTGSWGHVPPYCSYQSGGDKSVHFNKKSSGKNDGGYTPICKRNPEGIDKDLKTAVPHTMDMVSLNAKIYNVAAKPGTIVTAKTTGNKWKVAQVMTSEDNNGRGGKLWLAELEDLRTCAIVVRGTNDAKVFLQNLSVEEDIMPGTDYKVMLGYQQHILEILWANNNQNKLYAWLQKCNDRGFKKIISGHSLGGAVATWLSIHLETKKESLRADYVVTFGAPRLVMRYGTDKCPRSLQTRARAVRIVTATTKLLGNFVDAAATMPGELWHDHKEAFCFESMSLDSYGNILKQDDAWPNWSYEFVSNHALGGWDLHWAESRYETFLLKAKEKKARGGKCYGGGTWCDDWGNFWGKGSCEKVCCHGAEWKLTHHECKAESKKCLSSGTWCDYFGILTDSCGSCCDRGHHYVWWKFRHECD